MNHNLEDINGYNESHLKTISILTIVFSMVLIIVIPTYFANRTGNVSDIHDITEKAVVINTPTDSLNSPNLLSKFGQESFVIKFQKWDLLESENEHKILFLNNQRFFNFSAYSKMNGEKKVLRVDTTSRVYPYYILTQRSPDEIYFEVDSSIMNNRFKSADIETFNSYNNRLLSYQIFLFGIIFTLIILNILLALYFKDASFCFHCFFLLIASLQQVTSHGISRLILQHSPSTHYLWGILTYLAILIFSYKYLKVNKSVKILNWMYYFIGAFLIMLIPFSTSVLKSGNYIIEVFVTLSVLGIIFYTITYQYRNKKMKPFYFTMGMIILTVSIIVQGLHQWNIMNIYDFYKYIIIFALALEGMLFTLGIFERIYHLKRLNMRYFKLAIKDQLTGLYNRYYLDTNLDQILKLSKRNNEPLTMLLMDIDHFKNINDEYGHDVGDQVLKEIATVIKSNIRESDLLIRWGGEEFLLILPQTDVDGCTRIAEKIRKIIENHTFSNIDQLTISIGGGKWLYLEEDDELFKKVDDALYKAKEDGRNRFVMNFSYYGSIKNLFESLQWSEVYESNNPVIDNDHIKLMELLKEMLNNIESIEEFKRGLNQVLLLSKEHFQSEEEILEINNYQKLDFHKEEHQKLIESLERYIECYNDGHIETTEVVYLLLDRIIMGHLISSDYDFFDLF